MAEIIIFRYLPLAAQQKRKQNCLCGISNRTISGSQHLKVTSDLLWDTLLWRQSIWHSPLTLCLLYNSFTEKLEAEQQHIFILDACSFFLKNYIKSDIGAMGFYVCLTRAKMLLIIQNLKRKHQDNTFKGSRALKGKYTSNKLQSLRLCFSIWKP